MIAMLLYFSLGAMVLAVLSNRFWRHHLKQLQVSLAKLKETAEHVSQEVTDAACEHAHINSHLAEVERRGERTEQELAALLNEIATRKAAPIDRLYVFDRQEPRPGRFYEATVRYDPAAGGARPVHRGWIGARRYILIADTPREAGERLAARFPDKHGFTVVDVAQCRHPALQVNRVAEWSSFRRATPGAEDATARPRTARA